MVAENDICCVRTFVLKITIIVMLGHEIFEILKEVEEHVSLFFLLKPSVKSAIFQMIEIRNFSKVVATYIGN